MQPHIEMHAVIIGRIAQATFFVRLKSNGNRLVPAVSDNRFRIKYRSPVPAVTPTFNYTQPIDFANTNPQLFRPLAFIQDDSTYTMYQSEVYPSFAQPATGIAEQNFSLPSVHPNPATDVLYVSLDGHPAMSGQWSILNLLGEHVAGAARITNGTIDISGLTPGIYFLNVQINGRNYVQRFVRSWKKAIFTRRIMQRKIISALVFLLSLLSAELRHVHAQVAATMTLWKDSAMGAIWNEATNTVAYGKPDAAGHWKIYLSDSLGNNETPLTWPAWQSDRHQWAEEWDPTGQYLICYVEKNQYVFESDHTRIPEDAIPGYGAYCDIWMLRRDGSMAWQLTNVPNDYDNGVCHGAMSVDGTKFAWTERIQAPNIWDPNLAAGAYVFKVADIAYGPNPSLTNVQTYQPGNVLAGGEVESISPDNSTIAVYSTFESQNIVATPLYTIDLATGNTTKLTTLSFSQCPTYTPDGTHFVYMTGHECDIFPWSLQGADWWYMNEDSTGKVRLTYMNVTGHPQCVNAYRLAGSLSFMSNTCFLGGIMTQSFGLGGYTAKVEYSNVVGIGEQQPEQPAISVFPNPANNAVYLQSGNYTGTSAWNLIDATGRIVKSGNVIFTNGSSASVDLADVAAGVYSLQVVNGDTVSTSRIVRR